jgi:putative ABC transport system ATP-binding protein
MIADKALVPVGASSAASWVIEAVDLWRVYKIGAREVPALRGLNLQVAAGTFIAVKGRSGSGKTTLLNCLGGLDRPTSGAIRVSGRDLLGLSDKRLTRWRREQVGFIFQSIGLLPTFSAQENVELMLRIMGWNSIKARRRATECLELVGLTKWAHHRPYEMSGGQQQRVAIARALANNASLILADEPTGDLDSTTSREILTLFRSIARDQGRTILIATHDPLVDEYVDQVMRLRDGQMQPEPITPPAPRGA